MNPSCLQLNPISGKYRAVIMPEALSALQVHWGRAYQAINKPPQLKHLPLATLLPGGEAEMDRRGGNEDALVRAVSPRPSLPGDATEMASLAVDETASTVVGAPHSKPKNPFHKVRCVYVRAYERSCFC
jgi:hypothetical protein